MKLPNVPNVGGRGDWVATLKEKVIISSLHNNLGVWTAQSLGLCILLVADS